MRRANKRPRGRPRGLADIPAHLLADIYDRLHVRDRAALVASGRAKDGAWRAEVAARRGRDARLAAWHFAVRRGFLDPAAPPSHLLGFLRANRADPTVVEALGPPVGAADGGDAVSDPEQQLVDRVREGTITAAHLSSTVFLRALERIETNSDAAFTVLWELSNASPQIYDLLMEHPPFAASFQRQTLYKNCVVQWVLGRGNAALIEHVLVGKRYEQYVVDGVETLRNSTVDAIRLTRSPLAVSAFLRLCDPPQGTRDAMMTAASVQLNVEVMRVMATAVPGPFF